MINLYGLSKNMSLKGKARILYLEENCIGEADLRICRWKQNIIIIYWVYKVDFYSLSRMMTLKIRSRSPKSDHLFIVLQ